MSRFFARREEQAKAPPAAAPPSPLAHEAAGGVSGVGGGGGLEAAAWHASSPDGASRLYSPYAGLPGTFDPAISRALLELPDAPEFVFSEEAVLQQRTWSENLTYVTGVAYLGGALAGGTYGAAQGARSPLPAGVDGTKLRLNRVLNAGGKSGRALGNAAGVAGLLFSSLDSLVGHARSKKDAINTVVAAAGTGALYKAPSGARAAAVWGAAGALLGMLSAVGTTLVESLQ